MTWVKLDDGFTSHPKIVALSDRAFRLHVSALCYCNRYLTDGLIPRGVLVGLLGGDVGPELAELVAANVWEANGKAGPVIHDYHQYQPTREAELARKEALAAGRSAGGQARAASAARQAGRFAPARHQQGDQLSQVEKSTSSSPAPARPVPVPKDKDSASRSRAPETRPVHVREVLRNGRLHLDTTTPDDQPEAGPDPAGPASSVPW